MLMKGSHIPEESPDSCSVPWNQQPTIPAESRFPLPALDLLLKHILLSSPQRSRPSPVLPTEEQMLKMKPSPRPVNDLLPSSSMDPDKVKFRSDYSLHGCSELWRSPPDAVSNLSLACHYFRDVIWRKRLTVLRIKASEDFKKLEGCVGKRYRDAIQ